MGKLSRDKGKRWEQELVRMLRPIFGDTVKRGLAQSRFGASEEPDIKGIPKFWFEAKHCQLVNVRAALKQAIDAEIACRAGAMPPIEPRWPVAICKDNQEKPGAGARTMAVMRLEDFLVLLQEWWERTNVSSPPINAPTNEPIGE